MAKPPGTDRLGTLRNLITTMPTATGEEILEAFIDNECEDEDEAFYWEAFYWGVEALLDAGFQFNRPA